MHYCLRHCTMGSPYRKRKKTTFYTSVGSREINTKMARNRAVKKNWAAERAQACPNLQAVTSCFSSTWAKTRQQRLGDRQYFPCYYSAEIPKPWLNVVKTDQSFPRKNRGDNWSKPQPLLPPGERKERWHIQSWKFALFHSNSFRQKWYSAKMIRLLKEANIIERL